LTRYAPLLAATLAFLLYLPSLHGRFLYDDLGNIVANRSLRDPTAIGAIVRHEPARPLLNLTWALNYAISGLEPWSYHLVNALIHAGNAALAFSLLAWMARRSGRPHAEAIALVGACLFAVTPMAVETVAYVSSRSTALCALFMLASLRVAVAALETATPARIAGACLLFLLALLTKEEAAALPLLLILLDVFFLAGGDWRGPLRRPALHAAFLALPALGVLGRRVVTGAWLPPLALDRGIYVATQAAAFPMYLGRALVPLDPAFFRGHTPAPWPPDLPTLVMGAAGVALVSAAMVMSRRWTAVAFTILWLAAALLPSSSFVPLEEMVVDHRAYLGGLGAAYLVGGLLWQPGRLLFVTGVLALLGARTVQYQRVIGDPVRAWEDAVRRAPTSAEARRALADVYAERGDPRAERSMQEAILLGSEHGRSWANLGLYYLSQNRRADAEQALRRAADAAPYDSRIRDNLGALLEADGRSDEAAREYEAAVQGSPAIAQPRVRLALLMLERGEKRRAAELLDQAAALEIDAEDARAIEAVRARLQ
jgi:Tfp pilus assembly protein PilF